MYNGHADVTTLLDNSGTTLATYYYDAFGNNTNSTSLGDFNNNIAYAGYQFDSETGLYYLNSRMYDPVTARFMQEDTYSGDEEDPLSLNLYTYCANNPITYDDPTGHVYDVDKDDNGGYTTYNPITGDVLTSYGNKVENISLATTKDNAITSALVTDGNTGAQNVIVMVHDGANTTYNNTSNLYYLGIGDNANAYIGNSNKGAIGTINTGSQSNVAIDNQGKIGTITTGNQSVTAIDNTGTIKTISTGSESIALIENTGTISKLSTGAGSITLADNPGDINKKVQGKDSLVVVDEHMVQYVTNRGFTVSMKDSTIKGLANIMSLTPGIFEVSTLCNYIDADEKDRNKILGGYFLYAALNYGTGGLFDGLSPNIAKGAAEPSIKENVLKNIAESKAAREASNYRNPIQVNPEERTLEGFLNNNVSSSAELKLYTDSPGFNNNAKTGIGGEFKRYGVNSHGGVEPHVHQPIRNEIPNGDIRGVVGTKTNNGGVTLPTNKDIKQLYDYIFNGKYGK